MMLPLHYDHHTDSFRRPPPADCRRTDCDAGRRAPFLPRRGRGNYPKPRHLLIASLCCWAVVAIIAGALL